MSGSRNPRMQNWRLAGIATVCLAGMAASASAQTSLTWSDVRDRFVASNPTLRAGQFAIDEARAAEVTANLRPNPQWSLTLDQIGDTVGGNMFSASTLTTTVSYLRERARKRELRTASAVQATAQAGTAQADLLRTMTSDLRAAFVQALQAKALRTLAQDNLASYDQLLRVSRDRLARGDLARIDLDRLELQRVSYESDLQTADVTLRLAKRTLLRMLNDGRTDVDQFDVTGPFGSVPALPGLDMVRRLALERRPDLREATQTVEKATLDHRLVVANGSTDPVITIDAGVPAISQAWQSFQPPLRAYVGVGVGVPLRLFDRNQGEKLRTQLEIGRTQQLVDATRAQILADVDEAYTALGSALALLQPYTDRYLQQAARVRDTVTFAYQRGGASLLDLLQAQQEYRSVQVSYLNLVGSALGAANDLNTAVGQEILP